MALRLIEVVLPKGHEQGAEELFADQPILGLWHERPQAGPNTLKILLAGENTERVLDLLEKRFSPFSDFRAVILPVEATIPRPEPPEKEASGADQVTPSEEEKQRAARVSRQELYNHIADAARVSRVYVVAVVLSSVVAAIGLMSGNIAVIIGAMVIAPLLGPNVALSLATTLGDFPLALRALKASLVGVTTAFSSSFLLGLLLAVDPATPEIIARTKVGLSDIVLALASGSAGALAFTTGISTAVIGVMVAVALLPPLVTSGLLLGAGHVQLALGAALLLMANVICVNLAGMITFLAQGIRPRTWWEADRAWRATRIAIALWVTLLGALAVLIRWSR